MKLKIRQWMLVGMLIILVIPRLIYGIPDVLDRYVFERSQYSQQQAALISVIEEVSSAGVSRWQDTDWQDSLRTITSPSQIGIILFDASKHEIFHSVPTGSEVTASQQVAVMEGSQLLGRALIFVPEQRSILATIFAIAASVVAIFLIGWQMGRVVVEPLEAMSAAARRIAGGDLDFNLPRSTVLEVADVRVAFQAMVDGLRESLKRQSELEEERRFFISAIAHDLRTPLFTLRGFLTRLERGLAHNSEQATRYISICNRKAELLERLVSDLFSYTKMEFLEQSLRLEPTDFGVIFTDVLDDFRQNAKEKEVELVCESLEERCILHGDAHLLHRAIGNLIDNALRHTPSGGMVKAKWWREEKSMVFTIEDTGPGISEHDLPRIFEAFYRGDDSRNPEYGGTGLGLTISRRILRAHRGDLTVQNRALSKGAIFTGRVVYDI